MTGSFAPLRGEIRVPADKSLSHRALMFSGFANGETTITCDTLGRDNLATYRILSQLGVSLRASLPKAIETLAREEGCPNISPSNSGCTVTVIGKGFEGLCAPNAELNCGNSGTSARLFCGLLAGRPFTSTLIGDASLSRRPFRRVTEPLKLMGARFSGEHLPLIIKGGGLSGISYASPVSSAQVKSAILLAGLQANGEVTVTEPFRSRDHTERMLRAMGCDIKEAPSRLEQSVDVWSVTLGSNRPLRPLGNYAIPGDFSAAAFFMVAGSVIPGSELIIRDICFNPTRIGLYNLLVQMGAKLTVMNSRIIAGEEVVDLQVESADLTGIEVDESAVALSIDEIPALAVAAVMARGRTVVSGASELRVKESDRIAMIVQLLSAFGRKVSEQPDGFIVEGGEATGRIDDINSAIHRSWRESGDHRISMCGAILEYLSSGTIHLADRKAVETSFPSFLECFKTLAPETQAIG